MKTPEKEERGTELCLTFRSKHTFLTLSMTFFGILFSTEEAYNKWLNIV